MKLFKPGKSSVGKKVGSVKLSSHLVKPARFASSKVSIKAPRIAKAPRAGKVRV